MNSKAQTLRMNFLPLEKYSNFTMMDSFVLVEKYAVWEESVKL